MSAVSNGPQRINLRGELKLCARPSDPTCCALTRYYPRFSSLAFRLRPPTSRPPTGSIRPPVTASFAFPPSRVPPASTSIRTLIPTPANYPPHSPTRAPPAAPARLAAPLHSRLVRLSPLRNQPTPPHLADAASLPPARRWPRSTSQPSE